MAETMTHEKARRTEASVPRIWDVRARLKAHHLRVIWRQKRMHALPRARILIIIYGRIQRGSAVHDLRAAREHQRGALWLCVLRTRILPWWGRCSFDQMDDRNRAGVIKGDMLAPIQTGM